MADDTITYAGIVMTSFDYIVNTNTWKLVPHKPTRAWIVWSHLIMQHLLCVLPMKKIWHFNGKFDQDLSLYCGSVKSKFQIGLGGRFLWESCELWSPIYWQFWQFLQKYIWKHLYNFYPIELTWRKIVVHSVCLKPVSMEMRCLHTLWRFTLPVYKSGISHLYLWVLHITSFINCLNQYNSCRNNEYGLNLVWN